MKSMDEQKIRKALDKLFTVLPAGQATALVIAIALSEAAQQSQKGKK
jgi:hypothetical protein